MGQGIDIMGTVLRLVPERAPRPIDVSRLRHVLIVKLSSIGDVVHALPVASALKRRYPTLKITWALEDWTAPLVEGHPSVDRLVVFPSMMTWPRQPRLWWTSTRAAVRSLREDRYDAVIDLQGLAKSAVVSMLSRAPYRIARAGQREGAHLVSAGVPMPRAPIHAVDEYLLVAQALGADATPAVFGLTASPAAHASIDALLARHGVPTDGPLLVVNPSAAQPWKHWPSERWIEVIDRLSDSGIIVLIGAASQAERHRDIARRARQLPVDLTGHTNLSDVIALLDRAALHLAPDTGTVHMAVALGTPVVAIYGPTPRVRVGPYQQSASAIAHDHLCGRTCPTWCRSERQCLKAVTVDEVVERSRQLRRSVTGRRAGERA